MDSSVTVYLDNMNKIVYVIEKATGASSYTYGYLINAGKEGQGLSAGQAVARIFTQAGSVSQYPLAEKVKINNSNSTLTPDEALALLDASARTDINNDADAVKNSTSQLIKYSLNAKNEINVIYTSVPSAEDLTITNNLILDVGTKTAVYKLSKKMLGTSTLDSSTKIFFVPTNRADTDEYAVGKYSSLANDRKYTYEIYDINTENGNAKAAVVFGDTSLPAYDISAPMALVTKIQEINGSNGAAHRLTAYVSGSSKTYNTEDLNVLADVKIGDVIKLKVGKDGVVDEVLKLFSPADNFLYTYANGAQRLASTNNIDIRTAKKDGPSEATFSIMYGTVYQKYEESIRVSLADVEGEGADATLDDTDLYPVAFTDSTVFYTYSKEKAELQKVDDSAKGAAIISFEDALSGASKIYVSSEGEKTRFVLIVID